MTVKRFVHVTFVALGLGVPIAVAILTALPAGTKAAIIGAGIVGILSSLKDAFGKIEAEMAEKAGKAVTKVGPALLVLVAFLTSCAWFQKHVDEINCVGTATAQDAPKLIQAIATCATVAGDVPACLISLINPAWGWTRDIIACFTDNLAGGESLKCTAAASLPPLDAAAQERLKAAAKANGWLVRR